LLGQVEASKSATVRTQTAGLVQRVLVEVGDRVTRNDRCHLRRCRSGLGIGSRLNSPGQSELARLEVGTGVKSLLSVEPNYVQPLRGKETEDNLRRYSELVAEGAFSKRTLVEARTAADAAQGERLQAEAAGEATAGPTREEIDAQSKCSSCCCRKQARLTERTRSLPCWGCAV